MGDSQSTGEPINRVLVAGATGGVGQLVVAKLLGSAYKVRALSRSIEKAQGLFGDRIEIATGDIRQPATLTGAIQNVDAIICCTGTTAFPSERWQFDLPETNPLEAALSWGRIFVDADYREQRSQNNPNAVDAVGVANLVNAAPANLQRFVFVSSCGVERKGQFPFNLLNAFGVLDAKAKGEQAIQQSALPYTIIRPARLVDGPYTSYDLNTLLQAKTDGKRGVVLGTGDQLNGETSRIDVAAACVVCLAYPESENMIFEIVNTGKRPEKIDWAQLFRALI
ncbi:MAG: SDR family oxidoreductase [Cyanobacteria bacterium J06635_1]